MPHDGGAAACCACRKRPLPTASRETNAGEQGDEFAERGFARVELGKAVALVSAAAVHGARGGRGGGGETASCQRTIEARCRPRRGCGAARRRRPPPPLRRMPEVAKRSLDPPRFWGRPPAAGEPASSCSGSTEERGEEGRRGGEGTRWWCWRRKTPRPSQSRGCRLFEVVVAASAAATAAALPPTAPPDAQWRHARS